MKRLQKIISNITIDGQGPFDVYAMDDFDFCENLKFDDPQGIYAFAYHYIENRRHMFIMYYLGKTTEYDQRFYPHHKEEPLKTVNPNCVLIYACNKPMMDKQEVEWIRLWQPPYNKQHNS